MSSSLNALIVGGGPAGAALGALLAQAGRSVEIIEKTPAAHDTLCGEFLSDEAIQYLHALGLEPTALGATAIHSVRLAGRELLGQCALPFTGMSLTRRVLDEALLVRARKAGANVTRGARVESLRRERGEWVARLSNGEVRLAASAFLATGKHDLHGWARPSGKQNDLVAFKMYFRLTPGNAAEIANRVELILFAGGYAGLLSLPGGIMNLCLLTRQSDLQRHGCRWLQILDHVQSAYFASYMEGATTLLEKPMALSSIPYGYLRSRAQDGLWRLGDQAAVIPSFSGDGISIALHSAHLAARYFLQGRCADEFQRRLSVQLQRPLKAATMISRLMVAFPGVAAAVRIRPQVLAAITQRTRIPPDALLATLDEKRISQMP